MKKKLISLLICFAMFVSLAAGCNGGATDSTTAAADNGETTTTADAGTDTDDNSQDGGKSGTITVWCWDPAFNLYAMEEAAKIYNRDNPDVVIDIVETAWEDIQTKIIAAASSGQEDTLPDILLMQDNALAKNIINYPDTFADLTNSGIDFGQFAQFKVALSTVDGKNYGVPFDNGAAISAIRTDIIEEAGFTIEDFTDITWSEYHEKGKEVLDKTGKAMLSFIAGSPDLLMVMLQSAGTWLFDDQGKPNFTDNEVLKEVVTTYVDMVKSGVIIEVNDWDQYISSIQSSTVAGTINGCWIIGSIQGAEDQSGLWAITNIPKLDNAPNATNYSNQGGSSWLVSSASDVSDIAIDFLAKTFAGSVELYETILPSSGALATYLAAGDSDAYAIESEFFGNDKIFEKITDFASKVPQVSYGVYNYEARDGIGAAVTRIVSGTDMDTALAEAQTDVAFQMGE